MTATYGNLQKYRSANPLQQWLISRFLQRVAGLVAGLDVVTVLDAGCAEGFVSQHLTTALSRDMRFWGVDIDAASLIRGQTICQSMTRARASVTALPFADAQFDLILCNEVLEHHSAPEIALSELRRVTRGYVLLSVPFEPWFRVLNLLRGKHLYDWGNDPEHSQHWGRAGFRAFMSREFEIIELTVAFPWILGLGLKRDLDENP